MDRPIVVNESHSDLFSPKQSALLVIDFQNDLCHPDGIAAKSAGRSIKSVRAAIDNTKRLIRAARENDVQIVYIHLTALPEHKSDSPAWRAVRQQATYATPAMVLEGTWGHQTVDELAPQSADLLINKFRYSGFAGTNLDLLLRSEEISTLILAGCSSNVCITSTAFDAINHDYHVVVPEDCIASWDDDLHAAALQTIRHRIGRVTVSTDLIARWRGEAPLPVGGEN